jgi:Fe(3+) dicitrate transport protein
MTNGTMVLTTAGVKGNQENQIRGAKSWATYLSYDVTYKGLKLSPGIRYEKISLDFKDFGNADNARLGTALKSAANQLSIVLPGIGVNYDITNDMSVFIGVHKGFSPPGMPSITSTTGQAKAESSVNYELGYRYEKHGFNTQITGFLNNYDNILGSDYVSGGGAGTGNMFNAGKAKIQGLEVSVSFDLAHKKEASNNIKLPLTLAYTYTSAKFQETFVSGGGDWGSGIIYKGDLIPFITPHLLTSSLGIESKNFDVTLTARYTGETRNKPGQDDAIFPAQNVSFANINSLRGFLIIDLSTNYKISETFTVFVLVNNLTNSKAIVSNLPQGYRPNIPLSFNFGVKANL